LGPTGNDRPTLLFASDAGLTPGPVGRIASGGEPSRLVLALRLAAGVGEAEVVAFDEIDAGIGGRVAHHVAARLGTVAASHQVFAITHLAQIAARADVHLRVEKAEQAGNVATRLVQLQDEARVEEVARMLGGDPESDASLRHARELLLRSAGDVVQNS